MVAARHLGIAVLILGVVVLGFACSLIGTSSDHGSDGLVGRYMDSTIAYFVFGIAMTLSGGLLIVFGKRL